jgi:hypothetical protein
MNSNNIGRTWSTSGGDKRAAADKIKTAFRAFLSVYAKHPIIITSQTKPIVAALKEQVPWLERQLGENLLGLSLGGSSIRGLNIIGISDSDVDYFIYTRKIDRDAASEIDERSQRQIKDKGFAPCDITPVIQLDHTVPPNNFNSVLGVFTGYFIHCPAEQELEQRALAIIKSYSDLGYESKPALLNGLKSEFDALSGNDPEYVAKKFMKNRAIKIVGEEQAVSLLFDTPILEELKAIARTEPYLAARKQLLPFPPALQKLLT